MTIALTLLFAALMPFIGLGLELLLVGTGLLKIGEADWEDFEEGTEWEK